MDKQNMRITVNEMEDTQTFRSIPEREYRNFFGQLFHWETIKDFKVTGDSTSIVVYVELLNLDEYTFNFSIDNAKIAAYKSKYTYLTPDIMATYIFTMDTCLGKGFISLDSIQYIDASDSEGYELSFANYADFKLKCTTEKIFKLDKFKNIGTPV